MSVGSIPTPATVRVGQVRQREKRSGFEPDEVVGSTPTLVPAGHPADGGKDRPVPPRRLSSTAPIARPACVRAQVCRCWGSTPLWYGGRPGSTPGRTSVHSWGRMYQGQARMPCKHPGRVRFPPSPFKDQRHSTTKDTKDTKDTKKDKDRNKIEDHHELEHLLSPYCLLSSFCLCLFSCLSCISWLNVFSCSSRSPGRLSLRLNAPLP
jgi:hypothetical protein